MRTCKVCRRSLPRYMVNDKWICCDCLSGKHLCVCPVCGNKVMR